MSSTSQSTMDLEKLDDRAAEKLERVDDESLKEQEAPVAQDEDKITIQVILAFLALVGQANSYEMSLLIPTTLLSFINADLGPSPSYIWISVSWSLCAALTVSISGRLSDIFGRRHFMLAGSLLGFIGTIVGATGSSINQMIASGVLFGLASGIQETYYACIMEIVPNKYRSRFIGMAVSCALPSFMSPLIGYALMARTTLGWRAAYWFMTGWSGCAGIFLFFFYKPPNFHTKHGHEQVSRWQRFKQLDFVGLLLFVAACALFMTGLTFGGNKVYPWKDVRVLAPLIIGVCCIFGFALWEVYGNPQIPLMPPRLFLNFRGFTVVVVVCFVCGMLYYSLQLLWPEESSLLFVRGDQIIERGAYAIVTPLATWVAGLFVWGFCSRVNHERLQIVIYLVIQTALIGSMASVGASDKVQAIITVFIVGVLVSPPMLLSFAVLSLGIKDQEDIGIAVGITSTLRLLGGSIATALYTSIRKSEIQSNLPKAIDRVLSATGYPARNAAALLKAATANTAAAYAKVPDMTPEVEAATIEAVKKTSIHAYHVVYLAAIAFGVVAIVCACFIRSTPLELKTSHRAVTLENEKTRAKRSPCSGSSSLDHLTSQNSLIV